MPINNYSQNPALRPTVLANEVLKNVYRPSGQVTERSESDEPTIARDTPRAA